MSNTSNGTRLEDVWLTGISPLYIKLGQQGLLAHHAALQKGLVQISLYAIVACCRAFAFANAEAWHTQRTVWL